MKGLLFFNSTASRALLFRTRCLNWEGAFWDNDTEVDFLREELSLFGSFGDSGYVLKGFRTDFSIENPIPAKGSKFRFCGEIAFYRASASVFDCYMMKRTATASVSL
ncbi:hypothetical protein CEXT_62721 [Caerostris extrusa]|uniref:Uncharacterized protein n=1 Tax=Caerostris extrusa TaxID=172846 RepID=A0AAV4QY83_CAEEX|nr:hypothetical protein CEXT_62721 [Caerostris extrusa]